MSAVPRKAREVTGYSILLAGNELAHDHRIGRPYFVQTKRAAVKAIDRLPEWIVWFGARVVRVDFDGSTYTVHT